MSGHARESLSLRRAFGTGEIQVRALASAFLLR